MCDVYTEWCHSIKKSFFRLLKCHDHNDWLEYFDVKNKHQFHDRIFRLLLSKELNKDTLSPELDLLTLVCDSRNPVVRTERLQSLPLEVGQFLVEYYNGPSLTNKDDVFIFLANYSNLPSVQAMRDFDVKSMRCLFKMYNIPFDNSLDNEFLIIRFKKYMNFIQGYPCTDEKTAGISQMKYIDIFRLEKGDSPSTVAIYPPETENDKTDSDTATVPDMSDMLKVYKK